MRATTTLTDLTGLLHTFTDTTSAHVMDMTRLTEQVCAKGRRGAHSRWQGT